MAPVAELHVDAPPAAVFAVLCDPDTYPQWLLGAQRIRAVDAGWPAPGTSFHHVVGAGPVRLRDRTTSLELADERLLVLRAGIGALGAATVRFELAPEDGGTHLALVEEPTAGVVRALWAPASRVLVWTGVKVRNDLSLQHLADLVAERHPRPPARSRPTSTAQEATMGEQHHADDLLDRAEAASVLGIEPDGVDRLVAAGILPEREGAGGDDARYRMADVEAARLQGG